MKKFRCKIHPVTPIILKGHMYAIRSNTAMDLTLADIHNCLLKNAAVYYTKKNGSTVKLALSTYKNIILDDDKVEKVNTTPIAEDKKKKNKPYKRPPEEKTVETTVDTTAVKVETPEEIKEVINLDSLVAPVEEVVEVAENTAQDITNESVKEEIVTDEEVTNTISNSAVEGLDEEPKNIYNSYKKNKRKNK